MGFRKVFTAQEIRDFVAKENYSGRQAFARGNATMFRQAKQMVGLLDEILPINKRALTEVTIFESAKLYQSRSEFYRNDSAGYGKAKLISAEFFEQCCAHMPQTAQSIACKSRNRVNPLKGTKKVLDIKRKNEIIRLAASLSSYKEFCVSHTSHFSHARYHDYLPEILAMHQTQEQLDAATLLKAIPVANTYDSWESLKKDCPEYALAIGRNKEVREKILADYETKRETLAKEKQMRLEEQKRLNEAARQVARAQAKERARIEQENKLKDAEAAAQHAGGFKRHLCGMFYIVEITLADGTVVIGFGISNTYMERLITHGSNCAKKGGEIRILATYLGNGADIDDAEKALKKQLGEMNAIINTGISGFITEATAVENIQIVLNSVSNENKFKEMNNQMAQAA